jgi:hypothetical protein
MYKTNNAYTGGGGGGRSKTMPSALRLQERQVMMASRSVNVHLYVFTPPRLCLVATQKHMQVRVLSRDVAAGC